LARVSLVSLGCPKNLVDSEGAIGEIVGAGHEIVSDQSRADVIVVNTCGFIESARRESMEAIRRALRYKKRGSCRAVIVIGCLSQRFGVENVDACFGISHTGKLADAIEQVLGGRRVHDVACPTEQWLEPEARVVSTPPWTAYLKVSDGCSNRCAYCAIPDIRGPYRSRPEPLILDEAKRLADAGVREVVLVGQDLTQYGQEWRTEAGARGRSEPSLAGLVAKLNDISGLRWIRLMYCYPTKVTRELIEVIAGCERVVKYIDLPLQHADDDILRAMNRRGSADVYEKVISDLRAACPQIAVRTTFIVGFPGETEEEFERVLGFVERVRFDRLGAFVYSREQGTPAARLDKHVPRSVARARYERLMRLAQVISLDRNRQLIGKRVEVLVEGATGDGMFGRSYRDAPEIDGLVYLPGSDAEPGSFVQAAIVDAAEYDLVGRCEC